MGDYGQIDQVLLIPANMNEIFCKKASLDVCERGDPVALSIGLYSVG